MCEHKRTITVSGKTSDLFYMSHPSRGDEHHGYVPADMNIGGGDYLEFDLCLDCGYVHGTWPVTDEDWDESVQLA